MSTAALNFARTTASEGCETPQRAASAAAHLRALFHLPPGEAFDSLLTVHEILGTELPKEELSVYEAGGGSTCFLPSDVLRRAHVTVVDIDAEQLRNNDYAQKTILGDIQTYRFAGAAVRPRASVGGRKSLSFGSSSGKDRGVRASDGGTGGQSLNAFFAISVNSPSMSMVNFCCCVGSAPKPARGVARRVTPQPMRAAVRMEAGADACL